MAHESAKRLGEAMVACYQTIGNERRYQRVQASAIDCADYHWPRDASGQLTTDGMNTVAGYLERTTEMWNVVPN